MEEDCVLLEVDGPVWTLTLNRPEARNAIDGATARRLVELFTAFDADVSAHVAVLTGAGGNFCAGADLKALASGEPERALKVEANMQAPGPLGPTRMLLGKPVIAAISGYAVAGGLELALWCDLRVADPTTQFGVFCRRFGVPLVDGGTVRLPRLIGESRALDMILTGRAVAADEALQFGLLNRLVPEGQVLIAAQQLAHELAALPQHCLRNDRRSVLSQSGLQFDAAMAEETRLGLVTLASGETLQGAGRFASGSGRHGEPE
ncbi:MAG: crotonase/enoyl-CoA hydratase family protein [Burkholderiaceae bacterium]|nr:crotonase/enoyl-CoA hydratase family protein [Burkholderiaceae bacterium]